MKLQDVLIKKEVNDMAYNETLNENADRYLKLKEKFVYRSGGVVCEPVYVNLFWSANPPADPGRATGVISINVLDRQGEYLFGGELDTVDDLPLRDHIKECLEFVDLAGVPFEEISEEEFDNIIEEQADMAR